MSTPKKTTSKKNTLTKKKVVKSVLKKTVRKRAVKKPQKNTEKKAVVKKSTKIKSKKTTVSKSAIPEDKSSESVSLPTSAGPRLQKKVEAANEFVEHMRIPMYRIAYVSAFCFVFVGIFSLASTYLAPGSNQVAQVCTTLNCDGTVSPDSTEELPQQDPINTSVDVERATVVIFDDIPPVIDGEIQVAMQIQNASSFRMRVMSLIDGDITYVSPVRLSDENYQFTLNSNDFDSGNYSARLNLVDSIGTRSIELGTFEILEEVEVVENETITESNVETQPVTDSTEPSSSDDDNVYADSIEIDEPDDSVTEDIIYVEPHTNIDPLIPHEEPVDDVVTIGEFLEVDEFILSLPSRNWKDREIIKIYGFSQYNRLELFVRAKSSLQSVFLGSMQRDASGWVYSFDSKNLPDGEYEIFASTNYNGKFIVSRSEVIRVENKPVLVPDNTRSEIYNDVATTTAREFYQIEDSSGIDDDDSTEIARNLIFENPKLINDLLQRYAVAKQTNNTVLVEAVERHIEQERSDLIKKLIQDQSSDVSISQIDNALNRQFNDLKITVYDFEELRNVRSGADLDSDTDADGISDWDEKEVYKTDPLNPDTDGDGYTDGAEIANGFNPLDASSESIVDYELPTKIVGRERSELFQIVEVNALVLEDKEQSQVSVHAEIKGIGLPNSFVTLYIFSSPVIVTVKTDADGSFVYRFDKELEDGEHEVYVAFTDNTGSIMAHSKPFSFVKQAEAFSPVGTESEVLPVTAPTVVETSTQNSVKFVLGISIIVLGFFLLMLGINLRETNPKAKSEIEQL